MNTPHLNCSQFKYCSASPEETIWWDVTLRFDSSCTNKAWRCNANTNSNCLFKISGGCLLPPQPPASYSSGILGEFMGQIHLFISCTERGKQCFFLPTVIAKRTRGPCFPRCAWGRAFGDIWDSLTTTQAGLTLISRLENDKVGEQGFLGKQSVCVDILCFTKAVMHSFFCY